MNKKLLKFLISEQSLNSLFNFLLVLTIAKKLGISHFGIFSIFSILLQIFITLNFSLIISPLMTFYQNHHGFKNLYISSLNVFQHFFSFLSTLVFTFVIYFIDIFITQSINISNFLVITYFFSSLLSFFFRYTFILENNYISLIIQITLKYLSIFLFYNFYKNANINLIFQFLIFINLITILFSLKFYLKLEFNKDYFKKTFHELFKHSKWLFYSSFINTTINNLTLILSGLFVSTSILGIIRIVQTIFSYANIINLSLEGVLPKMLGLSKKKINFNIIRIYFLNLTFIFIVSFFLIYVSYDLILSFFSISSKYTLIYFILFSLSSLLSSYNTILKIIIRSADQTKFIFKTSLILLIIFSLLSYPVFSSFSYLAPALIIFFIQFYLLILFYFKIRFFINKT